MTSNFFNELEILLPNTTITSPYLAFSSHLQFAARSSILIYKTWTESGQEYWLVNLRTILSEHLHCEKPKNRISLQTKSRMAAASCFRGRFSDWRSLASWHREWLHHYSHERYPLEFLATDFQHRWQKYFTSLDWSKPETAYEKSVAPKVRPKLQARK